MYCVDSWAKALDVLILALFEQLVLYNKAMNIREDSKCVHVLTLDIPFNTYLHLNFLFLSNLYPSSITTLLKTLRFLH